MTRLLIPLLYAGICAAHLVAADVPASSVSKIFEQQLAMTEQDVVPLAEAMPADKYDFAPSQGDFKGVRTFGQQVSHVAAVIHAVSAGILGEKNTISMGDGENGPASLKAKDDIVKFLKESFTHAHKAMASLTAANLTEMVQSPFGDNKIAKMELAMAPVWHSFDHYGQMVVYGRMNGVVPPASRK